jgi:hypothetical protein
LLAAAGGTARATRAAGWTTSSLTWARAAPLGALGGAGTRIAFHARVGGDSPKGTAALGGASLDRRLDRVVGKLAVMMAVCLRGGVGRVRDGWGMRAQRC